MTLAIAFVFCCFLSQRYGISVYTEKSGRKGTTREGIEPSHPGRVLFPLSYRVRPKASTFGLNRLYALRLGIRNPYCLKS
jgi:hypothetical protein